MGRHLGIKKIRGLKASPIKRIEVIIQVYKNISRRFQVTENKLHVTPRRLVVQNLFEARRKKLKIVL